jgi:hypothetical protein
VTPLGMELFLILLDGDLRGGETGKEGCGDEKGR